MGRVWLNIQGADASAAGTRFELKPGLSVIGGARGDVPVPSSGGDCLHVWSDPPKLIFVGGGAPPKVNGQPAPEVSLHTGDKLEWCGLVATFGSDDPKHRLEEIPSAWMTPVGGVSAPAVAVAVSSEGVAPWQWVKAGIVAEMSLADADAIKRWQDAASRGEFDAASASRELLATAGGIRDDDPRLAERSSRLMRDLLNPPTTRRAPRLSTQNSRGCFAILMTQLLTLVLITLIVVAALLVARTRYQQSIDAQLDRIIKMM